MLHCTAVLHSDDDDDDDDDDDVDVDDDDDGNHWTPYTSLWRLILDLAQGIETK